MPVSTTHPEYADNLEIWQSVRDASEGERAIKRGDTRYLPQFVPEDQERYKQYKKRAYFMGVTGRTEASLIGMIFRKAPDYAVPNAMEAIINNMDGMGMSVEQMAKEAASNLMEAGRHILLTDYPQAEDGLDAETESRMGLRPTVASYPAEALINWRVEGINGRQMLTLAVLAEEQNVDTVDEFSHDTETTYRVLRLRDEVYTQQVYNEQGTPITDEYAPRQAGGAFFDHIPMQIVGASNNKPDIDMPPLYDLAVVNIAHYQTTADHRENLYIHGQLTLGITSDMSAEEFKTANPDGVRVGARTGHFLGANGAFTTATAPESSSLSKALADLEDQMIMLGARLVQRTGQPETAEATRINASAEASTLDVLTNNLSEAIQAALQDCARFMGQNPEAIEFALNTDFWEAGLDPQGLQAITAARQANMFGDEEALHMIRRGRIQLPADKTDEQILEGVANRLIDQ